LTGVVVATGRDHRVGGATLSCAHNPGSRSGSQAVQVVPRGWCDLSGDDDRARACAIDVALPSVQRRMADHARRDEPKYRATQRSARPAPQDPQRSSNQV